MQFHFRNVGMIRKASIKVEGLTVLTGWNDIGKSFIGRSLFALIRSLHEVEEQFLSQLYKEVLSVAEDITQLYKGPIPISLTKFFFPIPLTEELTKPYRIYLESCDAKVPIHFVEAVYSDYLANLYEIQRSIHSYLDQVEPDSDMVLELAEYFHLFRQIPKSIHTRELYEQCFDAYIQSLFNAELNNHYHPHEKASIEYHLSQDQFLRVDLAENRFVNVEAKGGFLFQDVIYTENSIIYQLSNLIKNQLAFSWYKDRHAELLHLIPPHNIELVKKITLHNRYKNSHIAPNDTVTALENRIAKVIGGHMMYDSGRDNFVFKRKDSHPISLANTSSGVKALGLLQLLLSSGSLSENTLLIVEEPEVHLHPAWQIQYAAILVELVRLGVHILLSSHSPYILRALQAYASHHIPERTHIYTGRFMAQSGSIIEESLGEEFAPFERLEADLEKLLHL